MKLNANDRVKIFGVFSLLSAALFFAVVRHGQEKIELTFMDIWQKHKDTESFKAGLLASKFVQ